ncbi:MAG: hypothetical protein FJ224_01230 [Lentisphaerae bacterium]|nr:hypothetical protein [Lentisphaerota bacterium]
MVKGLRSAVFVFGVSLGLVAAAQTEVMPVKGLRVPFEFYPNGAVKTELLAETARMDEDGDAVAKGITVVFFRQDGAVEGLMRARDCWYNKGFSSARSDGPVQFEKNGLEISGTGYEWQVSNKVVVIRSGARVVLPRGEGGSMLGPLGKKRTVSGGPGGEAGSR